MADARSDPTAPALPEHSRRWRALFGFQLWASTPMAILSAVWLGIAVLDLTGNSNALLDTIAMVIWGLFIAEFALSLYLAPDRLRFVRKSWLTVIALVVPALRLLRPLAALRAASMLRGANLVRVVGVINRAMVALRKTLRRRAFGYVFALTAAVLVAGAAGMYNFEPAKSVEGGFTSFWDALWWTGMLLTSIGSQYWPQTSEGRILGFLIAVYGLGILGYMTATIATFFIGREAADPASDVIGSDDIKALRDEVKALREALAVRPPSLRPARVPQRHAPGAKAPAGATKRSRPA